MLPIDEALNLETNKANG